MTRPYRVVCNAEDKVLWLAERHKLITGSDMAIVTGLAPGFFAKSKMTAQLYKTMSEDEKKDWLYKDLVRVKAGPVEPPLLPNRKMFWGTLCEQDNMRYFTKLTGARTRHCNVLFASTQNERVGATTDGFVKGVSDGSGTNNLYDACSSREHVDNFWPGWYGKEGLGLIEMKNTDPSVGNGYALLWSKFWKEKLLELDERVPGYYWVQVQTGLYTLGLLWAVLVIRIGLADIRCHVIDYDEQWIHDMMLPAVDMFWEEVDGQSRD